MAVRWAKCLTPFQTLSPGDQVGIVTREGSSNDTCLDAAASRMLEGPVPSSPVPVVRGLGHFPPADRQGRDTVSRNRGRGQSGPRDHHKVSLRLSNIQDAKYCTALFKVPRHAAGPDRVRLHEDHCPVQAGDCGPGRAEERGDAAGPGPVHPRRLRQEQIHQPAHQVRAIESVKDNSLPYFFVWLS